MKLRIKFLGSGPFAEPIRDVLAKRFGLVDENPDLQVVANYGRILTQDEIEAPKYGTINIHPSCLPKYRGASPLQTAILNGEEKTCVCIIKMVKLVDAGPILGCEEIKIDPNETFESLTKKTAQLASQLIPLVILQYISGSISPQQQDESKATQTKKLVRDDGKLDLSKPPEMLERQIRAYHPWPGSFIILEGGSRLIIHQAHLEKGKLVLDLVQKEGRKPIAFEQFKLGFRGKLPL